MLEAIENEAQLQLMAAIDGQKESDFRMSIMMRIDTLRSGRSNDIENQSYSFDGCWTEEIRAEVADRLEAILNTYYPTTLGY